MSVFTLLRIVILSLPFGAFQVGVVPRAPSRSGGAASADCPEPSSSNAMTRLRLKALVGCMPDRRRAAISRSSYGSDSAEKGAGAASSPQ